MVRNLLTVSTYRPAHSSNNDRYVSMMSDFESHIFDLIEENEHQIQVNKQLIQSLSYDAGKYKQIRLLQKAIETRRLDILNLQAQLSSVETGGDVASRA